MAVQQTLALHCHEGDLDAAELLESLEHLQIADHLNDGPNKLVLLRLVGLLVLGRRLGEIDISHALHFASLDGADALHIGVTAV